MLKSFILILADFIRILFALEKFAHFPKLHLGPRTCSPRPKYFI